MSNEKTYIAIPWASWRRFLPILVTVALAYFGFRYILICWTHFELGSLTEDQYYSLPQLMIYPLFIIEYCLISLTFICIIAWIKKGFRNLKSIDDNGLISWLIGELIIGMIIWRIFEPIGGLIIGLLFIGLVLGLFGGLVNEFKDWLSEPQQSSN